MQASDLGDRVTAIEQLQRRIKAAVMEDVAKDASTWYSYMHKVHDLTQRVEALESEVKRLPQKDPADEGRLIRRRHD